MAKLQQMISIYSVVLLLGIGLYMMVVQARTFKTVEHLQKEAKFSRTVGAIYIGLGLASAVILLL